jgi:BASS family bile acid:Na+ symporter
MAELPSQLKRLYDAYGKVFALIIAMALGVLLPQIQVLSFLIRYLLMVMLFFAFLDMHIQFKTFRQGVWRVLLANLAVAFLGYGVLSLFDHNLALSAFLTGIAPTATASPVLISFVGGEVPFVAAAVLLTNVVIALVIPFALPAIVGANLHISVWEVLQPVLVVMFVPLILAQLAGQLPQKGQVLLRKGKRYNFLVWLLNLLIVSANASNFVRNEHTGSLAPIFLVALLSLVICIINFVAGALIAEPAFRQESSQALGQKNITFVVWIALTFINPLAAMGPTFYILYHNLYNSWQIYRFEKQNKEVL